MTFNRNKTLGFVLLVGFLSFVCDPTNAQSDLPDSAKVESLVSKLMQGLVSEFVSAAKEIGTGPLDASGTTALHMACQFGNAEAVSKLLDAGWKADVRTTSGSEPMHEVASLNRGLVTMMAAGSYEKFKSAPPPAKPEDLFLLAEDNQKKIIALLKEHGADPETKNNAGKTPLNLAVESENKAAVEALIAAGAKSSAASDQDSVVITAIEKSDAKTLEILLKSGAKLPDQFQHYNGMTTPMHIAAENGDTEMIDLLLSYGANINSRDYTDSTPLHSAAFNRQQRAVEHLLSKGANPNLKSKLGGTPLETVVNYATEDDEAFGSNKITETLLKARPTNEALNESLQQAVYNDNLKMISLLISQGADVNSVANGQTPLCTAIQSQNFDAVKLLVEKGADVNKIAPGTTENALSRATWWNKEAIEFLLQKGANPNIGTTSSEKPLDNAIRSKHPEITDLLVKSGATVDADQINGRSLLFLAAEAGDVNLIKLFLKNGATIDQIEPNYSMTPLQWAAQHGQVEAVKALIDAGANIKLKDSRGRNLLVLASNSVDLDPLPTIKLLIERKLPINEPSLDGQTALHAACFGSNVDNSSTIEFLLSKGAKVNLVTSYGLTPLHLLARLSNRERVTKSFSLLLKAGADLKAKTNDGKTALHIAIEEQNIDGMAELIKANAPIDIPDSANVTPAQLVEKSPNQDLKKVFSELISKR